MYDRPRWRASLFEQFWRSPQVVMRLIDGRLDGAAAGAGTRQARHRWPPWLAGADRAGASSPKN
jgi:hypothetical protein